MVAGGDTAWAFRSKFKGHNGIARRGTVVAMAIGVGVACLAGYTTAKGAEPGGGGGRGWIVFASTASGNWDIWSVKPDGTDLTQITATTVNEHSPAVSPDGKEIVFVDAERSLRTMNPHGSNRREIHLPKGIYAQPAWAPCGHKIAFVRFFVMPSDSSEIWSMERTNGEWGDPERLSECPPMRLFPSFSPDGTRIAYTQFSRDGLLGTVEEIGILNLTENVFEEITSDGVDSFKPAWSPSGRYIAYTSNKSGHYDIWVVSVEDGMRRQLTSSPFYDGEPTWSPDGDEIAFVSTRSGSKEIWIVSIFGESPRQVTNMGVACKDPFWKR